jgi:pyridoxal phosphate enzyme (YggS family)
MAIDAVRYQEIVKELSKTNTTLVAVSKTKPVEDIKALYDLGHRDFGENYVQELAAKAEQLPKDIRWHFIGHLQRNKVKYIAPFVHLLHGVDSLKLLSAINDEGRKINRTLDCLLQVHIAVEESKFGFEENELLRLFDPHPEDQRLKSLHNVRLRGLMGMASFTEDMDKVRTEFRKLKTVFDKARTFNSNFEVLSMGMSADYKIAIEEGSTMVRIGSLIFGERSLP